MTKTEVIDKLLTSSSMEADSVSGATDFGARVMISPAVFSRRFEETWRRKSPSVMIPMSCFSSSVTPSTPKPLCVIRTMPSLIGVDSDNGAQPMSSVRDDEVTITFESIDNTNVFFSGFTVLTRGNLDAHVRIETGDRSQPFRR